MKGWIKKQDKAKGGEKELHHGMNLKVHVTSECDAKTKFRRLRTCHNSEKKKKKVNWKYQIAHACYFFKSSIISKQKIEFGQICVETKPWFFQARWESE